MVYMNDDTVDIKVSEHYRSTVRPLRVLCQTLVPIQGHQVSRQSRGPPRGRPPGPSWENQSGRERSRTHDRQQAVHQCAAPGESYPQPSPPAVQHHSCYQHGHAIRKTHNNEPNEQSAAARAPLLMFS